MHETEVEPTEADVMAHAPELEVDCREFADAELGVMVRMACEGADAADIAYEIGEPVTPRQVVQALYRVRRRLVSRAEHPHARGRAGKGRPWRSTKEQRDEVARLAESGVPLADIARRLRMTYGQVRYVREHWTC